MLGVPTFVITSRLLAEIFRKKGIKAGSILSFCQYTRSQICSATLVVTLYDDPFCSFVIPYLGESAAIFCVPYASIESSESREQALGNITAIADNHHLKMGLLHG